MGATITTPPVLKYDSGWFAAELATGYVKTHNLGSTKLNVTVFFANDSGGAPDLTHIYEAKGVYTTGVYYGGCCLRDVTDTQFTVQTAAHNMAAYIISNGTLGIPVSGWLRAIAMRA